MYKAIENGKSVFRPLKTTFNGQTLEDVLRTDQGSFKTIKVDGRGLLDESHQVTDVLGRHGGYFHRSRAKSRMIKVLAHLRGNSSVGLSKQYSLLGRLLATEQPAWLAFSDDSERSFLAQYEGVEVTEERADDAILILSFVCYDPFKYSAERTVSFTAASRAISYVGDVATKPVIELTARSAMTELKVLHVQKQEYVRLVLPTAARLVAGDKVIIDMRTGAISIRGQNGLEYLDMVNSRFFALNKGNNTLQFNAAVDAVVRYREVYR